MKARTSPRTEIPAAIPVLAARNRAVAPHHARAAVQANIRRQVGIVSRVLQGPIKEAVLLADATLVAQAFSARPMQPRALKQVLATILACLLLPFNRHRVPLAITPNLQEQ